MAGVEAEESTGPAADKPKTGVQAEAGSIIERTISILALKTILLDSGAPCSSEASLAITMPRTLRDSCPSEPAAGQMGGGEDKEAKGLKVSHQ